MDKRRLTLPGTTVPFWTYTRDGIRYIEFDTSRCGPPEPMINLMHALDALKHADERVVMINMQEPLPMYPRLEKDLQWEVTQLENGDVRIEFSLR